MAAVVHAYAITVNSAAGALVLGFLAKSATFAIAAHHALYFVGLFLTLGFTAPSLAHAYVFAPAAAAWLGALLGHGLSLALNSSRVLVDVRESPRRLLERVPYLLLMLVGLAAVVLGVALAIEGDSSTAVLVVALLFGVLLVLAAAAGLVLVHGDVSTLVHALAAAVLVGAGALIYNATSAADHITPTAAAGYTALALLVLYIIVGGLFTLGADTLHLARSRSGSAFAWLLLYIMVASLYFVASAGVNVQTGDTSANVLAYLFVAFWVGALVLLALVVLFMYSSGALGDLAASFKQFDEAPLVCKPPAYDGPAYGGLSQPQYAAIPTQATSRALSAELNAYDDARAAAKGVRSPHAAAKAKAK